MNKRVKQLLLAGVAVGLVFVAVVSDFSDGPFNGPVDALDPILTTPDWAMIAAWPGIVGKSSVTPDPDRMTTVIVIDDSGSMGRDIGPAKDAIAAAIGRFSANGRVAVLALNAGLVLPAMQITQARRELPRALGQVRAHGGTPLGASLQVAYGLLQDEAAAQRGFGQYRALITTDGEAGDGELLKEVIAIILAESPVQVTTIGIGIGEGHVLNMPGYTEYVSISGVEGLAAALRQVTAEQTQFAPITDFSAGADN